jgi:hypothetical protein
MSDEILVCAALQETCGLVCLLVLFTPRLWSGVQATRENLNRFNGFLFPFSHSALSKPLKRLGDQVVHPQPPG